MELLANIKRSCYIVMLLLVPAAYGVMKVCVPFFYFTSFSYESGRRGVGGQGLDDLAAKDTDVRNEGGRKGVGPMKLSLFFVAFLVD